MDAATSTPSARRVDRASSWASPEASGRSICRLAIPMWMRPSGPRSTRSARTTAARTSTRTPFRLPRLNPGQTTLPSATANDNRGFGTYHMIRIDPGARLPGIPAHNFNASITWHATQSWQLGLTVIAHSLSYMRGNENNLHQPGGTDQEIGMYICDSGICRQQAPRDGRPFTLGGTTPGFAGRELQHELRDREEPRRSSPRSTTSSTGTTSAVDGWASRLFSPSVHGAIGPSGWNYNSSEWQNTSFLAPGAPRGVFVGLRYLRDSR